MNRKQRDANRQTAREARDAIKRRSVAGQQWHVRTWVLADPTDGARKARFGIDPEQDPPVLIEGESDLTKVLGHVWVSTSVLSPIRYIDAPAKEPT